MHMIPHRSSVWGPDRVGIRTRKLAPLQDVELVRLDCMRGGLFCATIIAQERRRKASLAPGAPRVHRPISETDRHRQKGRHRRSRKPWGSQRLHIAGLCGKSRLSALAEPVHWRNATPLCCMVLRVSSAVVGGVVFCQWCRAAIQADRARTFFTFAVPAAALPVSPIAPVGSSYWRRSQRFDSAPW